MEELVGHRVDRHDDVLVGVPPCGGGVRLHRLPPRRADPVVGLLSAAAGDHVEELLDLGTAVNGDAVLVLPELPTALADVLQRGVSPGEAVTILVPLAVTVSRLHGIGAAHGTIGVPAVRFDARGTPVLTGFDRGVLRASAGEAAFSAGVATDDEGLRSLAVTVLAAAGAVAAPLAVELAAGALATSALPDALFALAEPAPVRLGAPGPAPADREPPGRLVAPVDAKPERAASLRSWEIGAVGEAVRLGRARIGRVLRGVRPRVWGAAAASLALLAIALVVLPGRGAAGSPEHPRTPSTRAAAARSPQAARPAPAIPAAPVAAGRALLAERRRCLALGSARCLAGVESAGSPIAIEDAAATAGAVEAVTVPEAGLRLRASSGGTAVLTAGSRTVLLLREPGGWRLRDVIGPPTMRSSARSDPGGGQIPRSGSKAPASRRPFTAVRNRAASAPSTIRWS